MSDELLLASLINSGNNTSPTDPSVEQQSKQLSLNTLDMSSQSQSQSQSQTELAGKPELAAAAAGAAGSSQIRDVPDLIEFKQVDDHCSGLQSQGKVFEALEVLEQAYNTAAKLYGASDSRAVDRASKFAALLNSVAMVSLSRDEVKLALDLLHHADELCSDIPLLLQTKNNIACVYRRLEKPHMALDILSDCLALCSIHDFAVDGVEITHLNACAIHSQLGK
jgi:Tetratricopeptide repeat